jgi:hypothetical protein
MRDADAQRVVLAMGKMMHWGDVAVRFLKEKLLDGNGESTQLKKWLRDLDSSEFPRRETATDALEKHLLAAYPLLQDAVAGNPSLEARQRLRRLLKKLEFQPLASDLLRDLRGLEVLEHVDTQAAKDIVREIAMGDFAPWLVQAAKAARIRSLAKSP